MFDMSPALAELTPSHDLVFTHQLGELAILGGLSDPDLVEFGLTAAGIDEWLGEHDIHDGRPLTRVWEASRAGCHDWMDVAASFLAQHQQAWRDVLTISWATRHSNIPNWALCMYGSGLRANCLLALTGTSMTVADVQEVLRADSEALADGRLSGRESAAFVAASSAVGGAVGFFTAGAGVGVATKAAGWAGDKLHRVDSWVEDLALRRLLAAQLVEEDRTIVQEIAASFQREATGLSRSQPKTLEGQKVRLLLAAHCDLLSMLSTEDDPLTPTVPNVVGMRLNDALLAWNSLGIEEIALVDACRKSGEERMPIMRGSWVVRGQSPVDGAPLEGVRSAKIAFGKAGETVLTGLMKERLGL